MNYWKICGILCCIPCFFCFLYAALVPSGAELPGFVLGLIAYMLWDTGREYDREKEDHKDDAGDRGEKK